MGQGGTVTGSAQAAKAINTQSVLKATKWASVVKAYDTSTSVVMSTTDIPNHKRASYYAVPDAGVIVPTASTAHVMKDPPKAQSLSFTIPTKPSYTAKVTDSSLGSIGLMISGAVLYNPYEEDGTKVWFVDHCNGHPTPMGGMYHHHVGSSCVISQVDATAGPSHLIGVALDGFPIYGPRDSNGQTVPVASLDRCNGIESPTPEFPNGIYHYVLPNTTDATSSIRCFHGAVDAMQIRAMPPMGGNVPDLAAAAAKLGITEAQLKHAFDNKLPPDLAQAAKALGITEAKPMAALGMPG